MLTVVHGKHIVLDLRRELKKVYINETKRVRTQFLVMPDGQNININLKNYYNIQYIGQIQLGSQNQSIQVLFDTGSNVAWVNGQQQQQQQLFSYPNTFSESYQCSSSTTCKLEKTRKSIQYGQGWVSGLLMSDTMRVGQIGVHDMQLISVDQSTDMEGFMGSGLVGLGYVTNTSPDYPYSYINQLYKQNQINHRMFSFYLNQDNGSTGSQLIIGSPDNNYYSGQMNYFKVIPNSFYWAVAIHSILFDNEAINTYVNSALVDSGTSLILFPTTLYNKFLQQLLIQNIQCVSTSGGIACSCPSTYTTEQDYPTINLQLVDINNNVQQLELDYKQYLGQQLQNNYCELLLGSMDSIDTMIILGDVFIQKFYTNYDLDNSQMGFAGAKYIHHLSIPILYYILYGLLAITSLFLLYIIYKWAKKKCNPSKRKGPSTRDIHQIHNEYVQPSTNIVIHNNPHNHDAQPSQFNQPLLINDQPDNTKPV